MITRQQCIDTLAAGCKPRSEWKVGLEMEMFMYDGHTMNPPLFNGVNGIEYLLNEIIRYSKITQDVGNAISENDRTVGVKFSSGRTITLEPGCQIELSQSPEQTIHTLNNQLKKDLRQLYTHAMQANINLLPIGYAPHWRIKDMPHVPKERYALLSKHVRNFDPLGLEMMFLTASMQVTLDFANEEDMVRKIRVSTILQPVITALFASSPIKQKAANGYESYRAVTWHHFNEKNCGIWDFIFDPHMGFEQYANYIIDNVGMYFLNHENTYYDIYPTTLAQLIEPGGGKWESVHKNIPQNFASSAQMWDDAQSFVFPEVRLRQFLEMRGADSGNVSHVMALAALWVGCLYDDAAFNELEELALSISYRELKTLYKAVAKTGINTTHGEINIREIAQRMINISREGLKRRKITNHSGETEDIYLQPLEQLLVKSTAQDMLQEWNQSKSVSKLLKKYTINVSDVALDTPNSTS